MVFFPKELDLIHRQLDLIEKIMFLLDQLDASTYETPCGRRVSVGGGSFYTEEAMNLMKTMQFAKQLDLEGQQEFIERKEENKGSI